MRGWYSRGYLPHFDAPGTIQFLTYRLVDSMPKTVLDAIEEAKRLGEIDELERYRRIEHYLDKGHGACWLRRPEVATLVEDNLRHFDGERYRLLAWCVMPNHVHAIAEMFESPSLEEVTHTWKSYTAHRINKIIGRRGSVWQREVFDRYMRSPEHLEYTICYVEDNPVNAGLGEFAVDWPYSSNRFRVEG
ncbi:MAG: transposase [Candidatus Hydrogenedentes bacterium]|nr:transposase [Candidatus Hydrogenedentota bacterium]